MSKHNKGLFLIVADKYGKQTLENKRSKINFLIRLFFITPWLFGTNIYVLKIE